LFPSTFIHVGGDECPKNNWKRCPFCQKRIKDENLKDEHELQSYFIQRIEKYLNAKGRTLIGWDEILEGGLAPNAVVMSWRGEEGGIAAAKENHKVIMTPGSHMYLNYSQQAKEDSVTIGGLLTLEKVYTYDPLPKELNTAQAKFILGAQANVWTEYIANESILEYMIFPRMSAVSEVLWSQKFKKDATNFNKRLITQFKRYELWKANFSRAYFDLKSSILPTKDYNGVLVKFETKGKGKIKYRSVSSGNESIEVKEADGQQYTQPIIVKSSDILEAYYFDNKELKSTITQKFVFSKATGKKITLTQPPMKDYPGDGPFTLVNGIQNEKGLSVSKEILGFTEKDCEALIDLGKSQTISNVVVHALAQGGSRVYPPKSVEIFTSTDGKKFSSRNQGSEFINTSATNGTMTVAFTPISARFVKVLVKNMGKVPEGKPGAGNPVLMLIDEIEVN
jgi:hexosaminidase